VLSLNTILGDWGVSIDETDEEVDSGNWGACRLEKEKLL